MKLFKQIVLAASAIAFLWVPDAAALTIVTTFIGGNAPVNSVGGGNLTEIVNAAARMWESAYADPITMQIRFGWAPVGDAGTHALAEQGGVPNRETAGIILFDNSGSVRFYLDPTPDSNDEYRRRTEEYQDLGGGFVNVARVFSVPVSDAVGRVDLLSVALHEIGHALGMSAANLAFAREGRDGSICITGSLPYTGTVIPLASNNSGTTSHFDPVQIIYGSIMAGVSGDERRIPSALDILANAQISGLIILSTNPLQPGLSRGMSSGPSGRTVPGPPAQRGSR